MLSKLVFPYAERNNAAGIWAGSVCLAIALVLFPAALKANENVIPYDTSVTGQFVPQGETRIEVVDEDLKIHFNHMMNTRDVVADSLGMPNCWPVRAEVTALYRLRNPEWQERELRLAFPIVGCGPEERMTWVRNKTLQYKNSSLLPDVRRGVVCRVEVNGEAIPFEYVSFESMFEKERSKWAQGLRKWLSQWPDLLQALESPASGTQLAEAWERPAKNGFPSVSGRSPVFSDRLQRISRIAGDLARERGNAKEYPQANLLWLAAAQAGYNARIEDWDLDFLSFAYSLLHPKEEDPVGKLLGAWGVDHSYLSPSDGKMRENDPWRTADAFHWAFDRAGRRIDFLVYKVKVAAWGKTKVQVQYSHLVNADLFPGATYGSQRMEGAFAYHFQYILRTSSKWTSFGTINISVSSNERPVKVFSLPFSSLGKDRNGRFRYSLTIPDISKVQENLHVGIMSAGGVSIPFEGLPLTNLMLRVYWSKYQQNPQGYLAGGYLRAMAAMFRGKDLYDPVYSPKEYAFLCGKLGIKPPDYGISLPLAAPEKLPRSQIGRRPILDEAIARRLIEQIPSSSAYR